MKLPAPGGESRRKPSARYPARGKTRRPAPESRRISARVGCFFKRRAGGISRREQQQRGQDAIPKDQRIRAVGNEIRRGYAAARTETSVSRRGGVVLGTEGSWRAPFKAEAHCGFEPLTFITASIVAELRTRINSGAIKNPMQGSLCIGENVRRIYSAFGSVFGSAFCGRAWPWAFPRPWGASLTSSLSLGNLGNGLNLRFGLFCGRAWPLGFSSALGASVASSFTSATSATASTFGSAFCGRAWPWAFPRPSAASATASTFGSAFLRPRLALAFPQPWGLRWPLPSPRRSRRRPQPSARPFAAALGLGFSSALGASFAASFASPTSA